jgi:hypothetical protein
MGIYMMKSKEAMRLAIARSINSFIHSLGINLGLKNITPDH